MTFDLETVYGLLPAVYRIRDTPPDGSPGPLLALLGVLADEIAVLEENLDQLYDDQFIETCADWVVPYIGDLLGVRGIHGAGLAAAASVPTSRTRSATAAARAPRMLEQLARDLTGWDARVVEFFELLATTQYLNHVRLGSTVTPDLRAWEALERVGSPFDSLTRTADVAQDRIRARAVQHPERGGVCLAAARPFAVTDVPRSGWTTAESCSTRWGRPPSSIPCRPRAHL